MAELVDAQDLKSCAQFGCASSSLASGICISFLFVEKMQRKIIHIDMDAFYAAVEQRDFPEYRGRPVVVCGNPKQRGVVATCSYEARKYGIHSAMAASRAYKLCPQAVFVKPRFASYREASKRIREIFYSYSNLVEPLSLDEAYLDVTGSQKCFGSATWIAEEIKEKILAQVKLTASAGVSFNKFLAKIASDYQKPNGLTVVLPEAGQEFVSSLKIRQFYGIGPATEQKMHKLKIYTGEDLRRQSLEFLKNNFGKFADYLYNAAKAIDLRPVLSTRVRKSVSKEITFVQDLLYLSDMLPALEKLASRVFDLQAEYSVLAKTLTLKVKYSNFRVITRSFTMSKGYTSLKIILEVVSQLVGKTEIEVQKVRLLGIGLSNF